MHYVKEFDINNVATRQVACIELHGKPNAATEGYVGVLGIDVDSTLHEVYKCVAVNGSIYSWELLSNGLSIISSSIFGGGAERVDIPYDKLRVPTQYVIKVGDTILDIEGYVYQIDALGANSCSATYSNTRLVTHGLSAYELAVEQGFKGTLEEWFESMRGYSIHVRYSAYPDGRDYSKVWRRGLNYIGIATGVDAPTNANAYQWSLFAPGIYVGGGDMPDYADIQIDPDGTYEAPSGGSGGGSGSDGKDGVSPTISVSTITGGHRLTITDVNGTKTVDIMDGEDGTSGKDGTNGADGVGISSIAKTATSGLVDTYTITLTNGTKSTFTVTNGKNGTDGKDGTSVTVKSVSESTADGGSNVVTFSDGKTLTIKNGGAGKNGQDGTDGVSPTVSTSKSGKVTTLTITDKNGTKTTTINDGTDGKDGADGRGIMLIQKTATSGLYDTYEITYTDGTTSTFSVKNGSDGTSVSVESVRLSALDGGSNIVTFSDGKTLTVKNGNKGADGSSVSIAAINESSESGGSNVIEFSGGDTLTVRNGKDGKNGEKGDPYTLTDTDKNTIVNAVIASLNNANGVSF